MKPLPCCTCLTLSMCKNKMLPDNIQKCSFLRDFICRTYAKGKLFNKIKEMLDIKESHQEFNIIIDLTRIHYRSIREAAKEIATQIDKDIFNKVVKDILLNPVIIPQKSDGKKLRNLQKKMRVINEISKSS